MKQNMDTAEKRINTLIAQKGKEISAIQDSIAKAEASADEARKRMIEATTNGDGQTYSGAKDQLRTAEDVIEMQRIRLDNLENNPMISPEEYNELSAAIQKSMTETVDKDIEEIKRIYASDIETSVEETEAEALPDTGSADAGIAVFAAVSVLAAAAFICTKKKAE